MAGSLVGINKILIAVVYFALNNYQRFNLILHIAIGLYRIEELEKDEGTAIEEIKEEKLLLSVPDKVKLFLGYFSTFSCLFKCFKTQRKNRLSKIIKKAADKVASDFNWKILLRKIKHSHYHIKKICK